MKNLLVAMAATMLAAACASTRVVSKRPLSQENISRIGETDFVVVEATNGITTTWNQQNSSIAGVPQGLIGTLVITTIDAMANSGPAARAQRAADDIREFVTPEMLSASLIQSLEAKIGVSENGVRVASVSERSAYIQTEPRDDTVDIVHSYRFSEDGSTFQAIFDVTYANAVIPYQTVYSFDGDAPQPERSGPLYRNSFIYHSISLPLPRLTNQTRAKLIDVVRARYADEDGGLPMAGDDGYEAYLKDLGNAEDDTLSEPEASVLMTQAWLTNDAARLKTEIDRAHQFIADALIADLNSTEIPSLTGVDKLMARDDDGRLVLRLGATTAAGSLVSFPRTGAPFATYGNAAAIARENAALASQRKAEANN